MLSRSALTLLGACSEVLKTAKLRTVWLLQLAFELCILQQSNFGS